MSSNPIRIRPPTHKALKEIATATGKSLQHALDEAIEERQRRLYLEGLADDCAEDGRYDFFITSAPLNIPGGVGSPPNALAIK